VNASRLALGFVAVALVGLWYVAGGTNPPATRAAEPPPRVAAPLAHENLTVYFVHGPDAVQGAKVLSLQEALDQNLAVVHETSDVNMLAVENRSPDHELFIQSGDIVKGGKQDRMSQSDMLLPPMSGAVPLPAHCVEQGRWTNRGSEDAARFKSSAKAAVGNDMKLANLSGNQGEVWKTVALNQGQIAMNVGANVNAAASPTSFQLTLEAPEVQAHVAAYEAALKARGEERDTIIGVVFVVNGQIKCAEVYGSNALFRKAWPKQLNSAAVEAVASRTDKPTAQAPSVREVEKFLAHGAAPDAAPATDTPFVSERLTQQMNGRSEVYNRRLAIMNDTFGVPQTPEVNAPGVARVEVTGPRGVQAGGAAGFVNPTNPAPDTTIMSGSGAGRVQIEGNATTGNRAVQNQQAFNNPNFGVVAGPQFRGAAPVSVNNDGNRLSSNVAQNRSTVTVESRDATRKNAVIHKSYIKK